MRSLLIILIVLLVSLSAAAQEPVPVERSNNKVIIEGKVYYIHIVKPGQTLYSISKAYNISQKEIAIENPGVVSGLQTGQALKIPLKSVIEDVNTAVRTDRDDSIRIHQVAAGETIYSISRNYRVSVEDILEMNPGLDINNLRIGDFIRIPLLITEKESGRISFDETGFIYHKVKRRETLYSISRYYEVTVEDIRNVNPELGWGGPKTGQILKIPKPQIPDQEFFTFDTIRPDTMIAVEPDTVIKDYNYRELLFKDYNPRKTYKVAFLIPFDFTRPEPLDSLLKDIRSESQKRRITEKYRVEEAIPQSVNFLEFLEGSLIALDSIRDTGMRLDIKFFDTKKSMARTRRILEYQEMEEMDLIIGPFYTFNLEIVSAFAREHNIPLITPFHSDLEYLKYNPYLFQITPSYEMEYRIAAKYIGRQIDKNIVFIHDGDSLNSTRINYFKEILFKEFLTYVDTEDVVFKEVIIGNSDAEDITLSLSREKPNLIIVPSDNEAIASRIVSSLYYQMKDYNIELFGTSYWPEFSSIDVRYFHELHLTFLHTGFVQYTDQGIIDFFNEFRKNYYSEPLEKTRNGSYYSILGYDITLYFLQALRNFGARFIFHLDEYEAGLLQCSFHFSRITPYGGYENDNLNFYQFHPDMTIKRIELPEEPPVKPVIEPLEEHEFHYLYLDRELKDLDD